MRPPQPKRPVPLPAGAHKTSFGRLSGAVSASANQAPSAAASTNSSIAEEFASSSAPAAVWQCAACRQVLADSNSFICNIPQLKLIVVSGQYSA